METAQEFLKQKAGGADKHRLPVAAKVAIMLGIFILILIIILVVTMTVLVVDVFKKPADVANAYVRAVKAGNYSTAWKYLSDAAKSETGKSVFDSKVRTLERSIYKWNVRRINIRNDTAQVTMDIERTGGKDETWYFLLEKQQGLWKIRSISEEPLSNFNSD